MSHADAAGAPCACPACAGEPAAQGLTSPSLQVHVPGLSVHPLLAPVHLLLGRCDRGKHRTTASHGMYSCHLGAQPWFPAS